jgi:hypothetical protein
LVAAAAIACVWAAVFWVIPSAPNLSPVEPAVRIRARQTGDAASQNGALHAVVWSGMAAPGGGRFDRFDVASQPIFAPVNARCQVAFFATVLRAIGREGIFIAEGGHVRKVAAFGDPLPGGGSLAEFSGHPLPSLNVKGHVAFTAHIAGGRGTEGVFLAGEDGLRPIALAGDDAPGIPLGVFVGFDASALNGNDELAFVATVRQERETRDVLYFWNGRRLQRLAAQGERLLRIGGKMDEIGDPALNDSGIVAFPAAIFRGPVLGGIFVAGAHDLRLVVGTGDRAPDGEMILRFSERAAIDDEDRIAFSTYLGKEGKAREAVLRSTPDGLAAVAVEGEPAPGGGRYAGFGPWPTAASGGVMAFIAALDDGPGPLAAFAGTGGHIAPVAVMGDRLPKGGVIGQFALNAVAAAGPGGAFTFATVGHKQGERTAIYCRCPGPAH